MRRSFAFLSVFFGVGFLGCTLATHGEQLSEGCPEGMKECEGTCVSLREVEYGCGRAGCSPCALPNSISRCSDDGQCLIASCVGSWEDCDRREDNGCETNLDVDANNCGRCDVPCPKPQRGEAACAQARCYVRSCETPYSDCNYDARDGCEINLDEHHGHCGECDRKCDVDQSCVLGDCTSHD